MQKAVGTFIGLLLVRIFLPMLLGPVGMVYFALAMVGAILILAVIHVLDIFRLHRLNRKYCDNALLYARRTRLAFDDPDFTDGDLRAIRRARRRGDFTTVYAIIAAANTRLIAKKATIERLRSAQASAQWEEEQRRQAEVRLYRA